MSSVDRRIELALETCATDRAPDPRVTVFDVSAERGQNGLELSGTVMTERLKTRAVDAVEAVADVPVAATELLVLETDAAPRTVATSVASVRATPDPDAERVTQALYGAALTAYDRDGAWRRVRTPDGYVAWVERSDLAEPTDIDADAMVSAGRVEPSGSDSESGPDTVALFAGTECEVLERCDDEIAVRFRTGAERSLPADAVAEIPTPSAGEDASVTGADVAETAREYLRTEYVWGGMTVEGIDCSGLTWMAYRRNGATLPRDADLQRRIGREVAREELTPGDLLFFPGHVAVSLGGDSVVHAEGEAGEVVVDSLDPGDDRYNERLDEEFELATRPL